VCQKDHYLEHKHECTDHLRKGIKEKSAVISRLQEQGSSDGVASVELMVLEQELAQVHYRVGMLMMASLQAAKFQASRDAFQTGPAPVSQGGGIRGAAARARAWQASWLTRQRLRVSML